MPALTPLSATTLFLLPLFLGSAILRALTIRLRDDRVAFPGWALVTGSLVIAGLELARLLSGASFVAGVLAPALVLAAGLHWRAPRPSAAPERESHESPAGRAVFRLALVTALLTAILFALVGNLSVIHMDDEAIFWSLRAKLLFQAGGFSGSYAEALADGRLPNSGYPILNPLLQLWCFDLAGQITNASNRWPIQLFSIALVLAVAGAVRRCAGPWIAAGATLALVTCVHFGVAARHASSDGLVACGLLVAWDGYVRWTESDRRKWLALCCIGVTTLLWAKDEGLALCLAGGLAWLLTQGSRARLRALARPSLAHLALVPPILVVLVKATHVRVFDDTSAYDLSDVLAQAVANLSANLLPVLRRLAAAAGAIRNHGIPVVFAVLGLITFRRWIRHPQGVAWLTALGFLAILLVIYLSAPPEDITYRLDNTIQRLLFQVLPLQLLWIGQAIARLGSPREDRAADGSAQPTLPTPAAAPSTSSPAPSSSS